MKNHLLVAIFIPVILLCSCASVSFTSNSSRVSADFAGLNHAGQTGTQREISYLEYLGVTWIQWTFNWQAFEPVQGEWNFGENDDHVNTAKAAGFKVMGTLAYDTRWIHEDNIGKRNITREQLPHFLEYVRKTTEHFKGRVDAWVIWNEPNSRRFWTGTNEDFFELTRQSAQVIREIDSEVIILGGAFNRNVFGLPERMIRGLFESGAMENVDGVAFHPYETNPTRAFKLNEKFKRIVADYGFDDKIWNIEIGYPTGGYYPTRVQERRLPEYLVKTWVLLAAGGVRNITWYQLFDRVERDRGNSEHFFGIVRSREDYTSKGAEAFRLCAVYLSDSICYTQIHEQSALPQSLRTFWFKRTDGSGTLVLWKEGLGSRQVRLQLPGINHLSHDPVSGNANPIPAETIVTAERMPVFITWQNREISAEISGEERPIISAR